MSIILEVRLRVNTVFGFAPSRSGGFNRRSFQFTGFRRTAPPQRKLACVPGSRYC